ncbi:hypothetical protein Dsui_0207 [Azospira oryzae PS]|uniref:NlpC/P60 domain-containing protein n=1 Tax=Azospira oryzae (strain ATCC BAA-33 / DSM 13638 / PS) TaxID=640081 RepID=G8QMP7_AZOOP|nr:hypothetical protein [Azospira oryzae]AEV24627.1 hypothetical protein Dsui_0207 [Azospira oryzae PS]
MTSPMRQAIVEEAISWAGTPYHHQACVKGAGTDCGMFLIGVFCGLGIVPKFDPRPYAPHWHLHRGEQKFLQELLQYADPVGEPLPGDIAIFRYGRCDAHGAVVLEWPRIIHAYVGEGVVEADASKGELAERFAGFYRVRGIE